MRILLRAPDILEAVRPLVGESVTSEFLFQLIASGEVQPLGLFQRAPVFELGQVADVARAINAALERTSTSGPRKNRGRHKPRGDADGI